MREIDVGVAALSEGKGLDLAFGVPVLYVEVRWIAEDSRAESKDALVGVWGFISRWEKLIEVGVVAGTEGNASTSSRLKSGEGRELTEETEVAEEGGVDSFEIGRSELDDAWEVIWRIEGIWGTAVVKSGPGVKYIAERFEDIDLRNVGSSNESGGTSGWLGNAGMPREVEAIGGILGTGVFVGESSTTWWSLASLVELNVLPPDFVLPRLNNFSANDVARAKVPEAFFGETEGNEKKLQMMLSG